VRAGRSADGLITVGADEKFTMLWDKFRATRDRRILGMRTQLGSTSPGRRRRTQWSAVPCGVAIGRSRPSRPRRESCP
jgi:hypothetical protein